MLRCKNDSHQGRACDCHAPIRIEQDLIVLHVMDVTSRAGATFRKTDEALDMRLSLTANRLARGLRAAAAAWRAGERA